MYRGLFSSAAQDACGEARPELAKNIIEAAEEIKFDRLSWPLFELAVRVSDSALVDAAAVVST
jgi:hypothetical protein